MPFGWRDEPLANESELDVFLAASGAETSGQNDMLLLHNNTLRVYGCTSVCGTEGWNKGEPVSWCYTQTHTQHVSHTMCFVDHFEADGSRQLSTPSSVPRDQIHKVARLDQK